MIRLYDFKTQKIVQKDTITSQELDFDIIKEQTIRQVGNSPVLVTDRYDLVLAQMVPGHGICLDACTGSPQERVKSRIIDLGYDYLPIALYGGGTSVRIEDLTKLSFKDGSISAVISVDTLEHIKDYPKALSELCRVLRADGLIIFHVPCYFFSREDSQPISPEKDPWGHVRFFSSVELIRNIVNAGFILLRVAYQLDYGAVICIATKA